MSSTLALSSAINRPIAIAATCVESNSLSSSSCCCVPVALVPPPPPPVNVNSNNNLRMVVNVRRNNCYSAALNPNTTTTTIIRRRARTASCDVSLRSNNSATIIAEGEEEKEEEVKKKIGARVRVKVPLKVYHVPRVPELDLTGMEGHLKQYVGVWKGKRISANLPFKVEFVIPLQDRGPVKFFAHLKEDEFEYLDS